MTPPELIGLVRRFIGEVERLQAEVERINGVAGGLWVENQELNDEIERLKGLPPRPPRRSGGVWRALLDAIDASTPIGLLDRALIGLMVYWFRAHRPSACDEG